MRRPGQERPDEIAYADVAMAILAPIMLLMVVFAVRAGELEATRGCLVLDGDSEELREKVKDVRAWRTATLERIDQLTSQIARHCPYRTDDLEPEPLPVRAEPIAIEALVGLCRATRQEVLDGADLDENEIRVLQARSVRVEAAVASCLGDQKEGECRRPEGEERLDLVAELRAWTRTIPLESQALEELVETACPDLASPALAASYGPPLPLAGLCPDERDSVIGDAGLEAATIERVSERWRRARAGAAACLPEFILQTEGDCPPLSEGDRAQRVESLQAWYATLQSRVVDLRRKAAAPVCAGLSASARSDSLLDDTARLEPIALSGLCPRQQQSLAASASIDLDRLRALSAEFVATSERVESCMQQTTEVVTKRHTVVNFASCQVRFEFADPTIDEDKHFEGIARDVVKTLERNTTMNRLDVIGRSDGSPPYDNCRRVLLPRILGSTGEYPVRRAPFASDPHDESFNALLSAYRAMIFARKLQQALERIGAREQLKDRGIRIYAIGTGTDQPLFRGGGPGDDDLAQRRIEIRYAFDPASVLRGD